MPDRSAPKKNAAKCPSLFTRVAKWTSLNAGRPCAFLTAVAIIVAWGVSGPLFHYSNTWQLVINTGTTIVTFLMVFLIQATQNRDTAALNVKLDELIRAIKGARNSFLDLDELSDEELEKIRGKFAKLAQHSKHRQRPSHAEANAGNGHAGPTAAAKK